MAALAPFMILFSSCIAAVRDNGIGRIRGESEFLRHVHWEEDEQFIVRQLESFMSFEMNSPTISPTLPPTQAPVTTAPTPRSRPTPSPVPTPPVPASIDLEWFGQNAYFSGNNVKATIDDGSMITFQDDFDRPLNINSGGGGEEVSREDAWTEGGVERRVKFYFFVKPPGEAYSAQGAAENGWYMYDARMYNAEGTDWVYWGGDYRNVSMVQTPPDHALFYCDYFQLDYVLGGRPPLQGEPGGMFVAENVTMGGYLETSYDVASLRVFNPCTEKFPGEECRALNGNLFCGDTALSLG